MTKFLLGIFAIFSLLPLVGLNIAHVNAQVPGISTSMHKCISLVITTSGLLLGLQAAQGTSTPDSVNSTLDTEIHNVEGCVLHSDRLFANLNSSTPSQPPTNSNVLH